MKLSHLQEESQDSIDPPNTSCISVDDEVSIKEEPLSPASSVSSKISETDTRRRFKHGRYTHINLTHLRFKFCKVM